MRLIKAGENFFQQQPFLLYLLLFVVAAGLFTYLQADPTFADPDSFYHAKMALILRDQGTITEFPWLSATNLKYSFIDHHFLYHLLLVPFVTFFDPLLGLKIATILFASLAVVIFYWFLRQLQVKGAFWYSLFLLTVNPFIFRLNLAKAQALVLILILITLYFLFSRRYLALLFTGFLYVWLYAGWPLLLLLLLVYFLVSWFKSRSVRDWLVVRKITAKVRKQQLKLMLAGVLGLAVGLFFNPYFGKNLAFYWQQSIKIAVFNYQYIIDVGNEWYPYPISSLLTAAIPFFVLLFLAFLVFLVTSKKQSAQSWFFLVLTLIFLALTLKSRRNVEYLVPLALIFSALSLGLFWPRAKKFLANYRLNTLTITAVFVIVLAFFYRDISVVKTAYQQGFAFTKFAAPAQWLAEQTPAKSIVFHSDWDEFPLLFYHNDRNYYLVGLDPTFMYLYDPNLYWRWVALTTGQTADDLYATIKDLFGADYVFVDRQSNSAFDRNLANNIYFEKVFENNEARIYQVLK